MENIKLNKLFFSTVSIALVLFAVPEFSAVAQDSTSADTMVTKILSAVENNDFKNFIADGDDQFKTTITKQMFEGVNALIAPRMKKGYEVISLGTMNQQGCKIYLRKLVFNDSGDDILAKLVLYHGKVAGFFFQ
jgi:hypothetical protein